ncbi:hypothetical protein MOSE0_J01090 [Monosporozyma servazzii]
MGPDMNAVKYIVFCINKIIQNGNVYKNINKGRLPICYTQFISEEYKYKRWYELKPEEKRVFVQQFVYNYQKQYPESKTNLSLKELAVNKEIYKDAPSVFGIFYDDIWKNKRSGMDNYNKRFYHFSFKRLLVER